MTYSTTREEDYTQARLYRSRSGAVFGVCKGAAMYFGVNLFWLRVAVFVGIIMSGIWPGFFAYILFALLMKPEPVVPLENYEDAEFYSSYVSSRGMALQRLKRTFENLDRRIQRMENIVTARDYDWERRLNE
jgi:phage shock protein C